MSAILDDLLLFGHGLHFDFTHPCMHESMVCPTHSTFIMHLLWSRQSQALEERLWRTQGWALCIACLLGAHSFPAFAHAWPSAWDGAHSAFSLWKSLPFLKGQFGSTSFHFFTMPSHSENESLFPVLQKHSASTLVWNSTVGIWSKCRLSPYFSCLYFPPTSPKLVGPDLP